MHGPGHIPFLTSTQPPLPPSPPHQTKWGAPIPGPEHIPFLTSTPPPLPPSPPIDYVENPYACPEHPPPLPPITPTLD